MDNSNQHLWDRFCRLGEMMGDGEHQEKGGSWISREYKKLSKILVPEINEHYKEERKRKNEHIDNQMKVLIESKSCSCGGKFKQSRSGSLIVYCQSCNGRFKAVKAKKQKIK